jgi:hypothetical protein
MNRNDRALAGLAWLAATLPTLVEQDCLQGDEITSAAATRFDVTIHIKDYATAARIAARLGLRVNGWYGADSEQSWWTGKSGDVEVSVMTCDPPRIVTSSFPRECMDEVTA